MTFRELRKMSGMTQKAFSEYFGIPKRTIEDWEGERNKCSDYLLELMYYKLVNEEIIKVGKQKAILNQRPTNRDGKYDDN